MDIEQTTLIWIARVVFTVIAALIGYGVWRFMRRERVVIVPARKAYQPPTHIELPEKTIALAIMAKPGRVFDTLRLFKVMHELGFHYAENQVFEYFAPDSKYIAFSIINSRSPYKFSQNPQQMHPTNGLMAVMQLPVADGDHQVEYFHLLLSVLDELRTNLDAELCDVNRNPLKNHNLYEIQKDIELFEQTYTATLQHDYHTRSR
ncbi:MAG: hypothetical protein CR963_00525 [Gammaproteobacteria bacterium]|nr:MAG: hypothetical protein CR963_00525 [Gammaproteobacteria bacterium]